MANINLKDENFLAAALEGLELQRGRIDEQIRELRAALGRGGARRAAVATEAAAAPAPKVRRTKRNLSAAARARIAAAQKKRWAEYRKTKGKG